MPCYCDTPNEMDQIEIERRCKVNMYFDCQGLLTIEQSNKCEQQNIPITPVPDVNTALCKICKILNEEQMKEISAYYFQIKWTHKTLYDWYIQHCKDDKENNKL